MFFLKKYAWNAHGKQDPDRVPRSPLFAHMPDLRFRVQERVDGHQGRMRKRRVRECVNESLKIDDEADDLKLTITPKFLDYSRYRVHVDASAKIKDAPIESSLDTEMRISWETCDTCSRISGGYFEGIVQIRADNASRRVKNLKNAHRSPKLLRGARGKRVTGLHLFTNS